MQEFDSLSNDRVASYFSALSEAAGVAVALIGCLALVGWAFDIGTLKSLSRGMVEMKANTAACLVMTGASIWFLQTRRAATYSRLMAKWLAGMVAVAGAVALVEYLSGWDMGVDQLLLREPPAALLTSYPGRMAPNTAVVFLLTGAALLLSDVKSEDVHAPGQWLVLAAGIVSLLAIIGYAFGIPVFYRLYNLTPIALNTAVAFILACLGVLFARPERGVMSLLASGTAGGALARRLLFVVVGSTLCLGWLGLAGKKANLYSEEFGYFLVVAGLVAVLSVLVWTSASSLDRRDRERTRMEEALQKANLELETKVIERTEELTKVNAALVAEASERGKAEEAVNRLKDFLERRVEERTAQLAAANKELEAFSYSVSHDLRAPLRSIDGFAQALLEDYNEILDEQGKDYLNRVRAASQRMSVLIDDMLKLSRLNRAEMRHEPVNLSELARTAAEELSAAEPGRSAEFIVEDGIVVRADPHLMRIVLDNLLGNAYKFTSRRQGARIEFGMEAVEGRAAYFVRDNGAGFDMAYADKLFTPFQRMHDAAEYSGTGIGLVTVQRVIHRHGGRVWAEAEVGKGATFYFTL